MYILSLHTVAEAGSQGVGGGSSDGGRVELMGRPGLPVPALNSTATSTLTQRLLNYESAL